MISRLIELWQAYKEDSKRRKVAKELHEHHRLEYLKNRAEWFDSETAKTAIDNLQAYNYVPMSQQELKDRIDYDNMLARVKEEMEDVTGVNRLPDECGQSMGETISEAKMVIDIDNVYAREVWNKAIEEAAKKSDALVEVIGYGLSTAIRKLKK